MNALGIIFCDRYGSHAPKHELIHSRTPASLPYAGRYRIIDFALSSMVNATIDEIGVLCKENYGSLFDHLGNGEDWDLNRRKGGIKLLTPLARPESHSTFSRGRLDALRSIKGYIADNKYEWVVMAFGGTVANIDLEAMLAQHIKDDAYLTIAYAEIPAAPGEMMLHVAEDHTVSSISYQKEETNAPGPFALGTAIMKKADLLAFLDEADNNDYTHMNRELIQKNLDKKKICGYFHSGYARIICSVSDYFNANMEMLSPAQKKELFTPDRPIYTKVKDSVPTLYDFGAAASNCLIADGCVIKGIVKNSILSRNVVVEEGAIVENCILMQKTVVSKNAKLNRTITDKNVTIQEATDLRGAETLPFVVGKGKQV